MKEIKVCVFIYCFLKKLFLNAKQIKLGLFCKNGIIPVDMLSHVSGIRMLWFCQRISRSDYVQSRSNTFFYHLF